MQEEGYKINTNKYTLLLWIWDAPHFQKRIFRGKIRM